MGSVLISDLIRVLQQPGLMPGMEEERQQLLQLFTAILPVIPDVEHPGLLGFLVSIEKDNLAETWIRDLNAAAYNADDILDEFRYAKLKANAKAEAETDRHQSGDKVRTSIFSLCKLITGMRLRLTATRPAEAHPFKGGMGAMREILLKGLIGTIGDLVQRSAYFISQKGLGLMPCAEGPQDMTLSSLKEINAIVVGRNEEKEHIVHQLLDLANGVGDTIPVLPIVAPEGNGKSALARFICDDARIKSHYDFILWVDAIGEPNIAKIAKSVIDQVIEKDCSLSEGDMDLLERRIYQELSGKRFLLVLDDVYTCYWQMWEQLISWLEQSAATGSSIIVTSPDTAKTMQWNRDGEKSSMHIFKLLPLKKDDHWTLFCRRANIANEEVNPEVREISQQILSICRGSLLLVNMMGGLMRFKKEVSEWQEVINQLKNYPKIHHLIGKIFHLCFNHLSSEMKECFVLCSLFPEGHYMDKEVLVKLWMANGVISSDGPTSVEERGNCMFNELALRHFFEDVKLVPESSSRDKHGYRSRVICKVHGSIYIELKYFHRNENVLREHSFISQHIPSSLKIRFLFVSEDSVDIPVLLQIYTHVRTLISLDGPFKRTVNCSVLPNSNSLRVLHLHSALFEGDLLELKYMKHLRYLDLSSSRIKTLPESTSSLYFLQTLNISKCLLLCQLPEDMRYMRSLRHLYVDECPKLKKMPAHLGQLSCLKTLTTYIIGESAGNGIDEIKSLDLNGLLEIYNLRKVKNVTIAKEVDLFSKTNLERLTLCWGRQQLVMSKENNDSEVLEALRPHSGLKVLKIQQYGCHEFANWLAYPVGLPNLVELHLIGCSQCSSIPAVWKLQSLRVLCLKHMINLTCISSFTSFPGIDEKDSLEKFPSLKRLVLVGLKRLERWHEGAVQRTILSFPVLDEMEISNCPELKTMPIVPMLKYLTIRIENHGLLRSVIDLITQSESLVEVNMATASGSDNEASSALGEETYRHNSHKLRVMRLDSTNSFFMNRAIPHLQLGFWRSLVSLENLDIFNCSSIVAWPLEEFRNLGKLKRLSVRMCPNLTGLLPCQLQECEELLPLLQSLEFYRCLSLKEIPRCSSILYLELDECPEIKSISDLNNLKMLFLSCTSWTALPTGLGDLKKLESLRVSECYSLTNLPDELAGLTSLQTLIINKCPRVESLPKYLDHMLSGLGKFQISECPDLEKFCKGEPYSSIISQIGERRNNSAGPSTDSQSLSEGSEQGGFCFC